MIDDGTGRPALDRRQVAQQLWRRLPSHDYGGALQRVHRVNLILRRLHGEEIGHPILRVQPIVPSGLSARAQRVQDGVGHILLGQPDLLGARAVHVHAQLRGVDHLMHMGIHDAGDL